MKIHKKQKCMSKTIFPIILWKKCCICDEKFGFEVGYKYIDGDSRLAMVYYMCSGCGGFTNEAADEIFTDYIKIRNKATTVLQWPPPKGGTASYRPENKSNDDNYITIIKETK